VHLLKSLKHALLIQSALYEIVKNAFFTESALTKFIKTCASYSKHTVQNCQGTRSLLKVHLFKSLKHTLLIQSALYKIVKISFLTKSALIKIIKTCASYSKRTVQICKRTRSLLKVHLLKSLKHALLIQSALYNKVKERVLY